MRSYFKANQGIFTGFWGELAVEPQARISMEIRCSCIKVLVFLRTQINLVAICRTSPKSSQAEGTGKKKFQASLPPCPTHRTEAARLSDNSNQPGAIRRELDWSKSDRSGLNRQNCPQDRPGYEKVTDFLNGEHYDRQTSR